MKKFNSVIFKDTNGQYYLGTKENNLINGFKLLSPLSETSKQAIESIKQPLNTSDFIVVTISETKKNTKITPITCGTIVDKEGKEVCPYDIQREELIDLLNTLIKPEYLTDPVKKPKKLKESI